MEQDFAQPQVAPSLTLLNSSGDVTVTWTDKDEDKILRLVEKKIKEGFRFFILVPRPLKIFGHSRKQVNSLEAIKVAGHVVVPDDLMQDVFRKALGDDDVEQAVAEGAATVVPSDGAHGGKTYQTVRRAASAQEVVKHQTMAVRPVLGG